jgi:DNA polymerase
MPIVADDGVRSARLVLIGEAYGDHEERWGKPFVGPSGQLLERWWRDVGLDRKDFYITNAWDGGKPPLHIDAIDRGDMEMAFDRLHERLAQLDDPWLIVPTGNYALYALTNKGVVSWHRRDGRFPRPGITSWRGSIMEYVDARGRHIKVIPTIHPASTFRTPAYERECRHDWARIAGDAEFRELRLPERQHLVAPSLPELQAYLDDARHRATQLAIDIETPRRVSWSETARPLKKCVCKHMAARHDGRCTVRKCSCDVFVAQLGKPLRKRIIEPAFLGCIGFAFEANRSLTIPTTRDYWGTDAAFDEAMRCVRALCALDVDKVLQNGLFDVYWLDDHGIDVTRYVWDTRAMHHCLDTTAPHDLAWLGTWYTRQPYWKDEAKDPDEIIKYADTKEALWTYNGIDVTVTYEVFCALHAELKSRGRLDTYTRLYGSRLPRLQRLSRHGVAVDLAARQAKRDEFAGRRAALVERITASAGMPLTAKTGGLSNLRLRFYLYGPSGVTEAQASKLAATFPAVTPLRLPRQYSASTKKGATRGERSVSTNEIIVRRLMQRFPGKLNVVGELILEHRRVSQLGTFVQDTLTDPDGRARCGYSPAVDTGRFASQANPRGTGRNLQNIDRELRSMYVPD